MADDSPWCPKNEENGFHCGHEIHRQLTIGDPSTKLTARCCWCDALEEITFSIVKIALVGHGMGNAQAVEIWDLPTGWQKGDG